MPEVWFTADLVESDDTDTNVYGDECEPGHGEVASHGWWHPDWSRWEVYEDRDQVEPDVMDDDPELLEVESRVEWLAEVLDQRLEGFPEYDGSGTAVYSSDAYSHPHEGKSIRPAAHPEGFTPDEIAQACDLVRKRYLR